MATMDEIDKLIDDLCFHVEAENWGDCAVPLGPVEGTRDTARAALLDRIRKVVEERDAARKNSDVATDTIVLLEKNLAEVRSDLAALREANRWIPIQERLPEKMGQYLWLSSPEHGRHTYKEFYDPTWGKPAIPFTHWRPLPQPPEES